MASDPANGILRIRNVSGGDYAIEELGGAVLADQAELDLLDTELASFYGSHRDACRACELSTAKLKQDIDAGKIEIVLNQPPRGRQR